MKRFAERTILSAVCFLIWLPLLLMVGNSFLSRGEMLSRFGPVLNGSTGSVRAALIPDYPTLSPIVAIGKGNVVEGNGAFDRRKLAHAGIVRYLRFGIQNLENPFRTGDIGDDLIIKIAQVHDRAPEHRDIGAEGDERADGYLIGTKDNDARKIQGNGTEPPAEVDDGAESVV